MQYVACINRQKRGGTAEQHGEEIERDRAQHDGTMADEIDALAHPLQPRGAGVDMRRTLSPAERGGEQRSHDHEHETDGERRRRTEREQEAAQRGTGDGRGGEHRGRQRDGARQPFRRDQERQKRLRGRAVKTARGAEQDQHRVIGPGYGGREQDEDEEQAGAYALHRLGRAQHLALVETVGDVAGGQREDEHRAELAKTDETERESRMRDVVDLPADRDRLYLEGDRHDETDGGEYVEVAVAIDRGRDVRHGGHGARLGACVKRRRAAAAIRRARCPRCRRRNPGRRCAASAVRPSSRRSVPRPLATACCRDRCRRSCDRPAG